MTQFEGNPEFNKLLTGCGEINLVHFMLEVAADADPSLDRVGCLLEIDRLGVACCDRTAGMGCHDTRERLQAISHQLYEVEGFHGNREGYYEPQNSYLNEVLARRCGIPISLGILYMAVAARAGLRTFGVNTPGHFVVGCRSVEGMLFVDPFNNGDVMDFACCKRRVQELLGEGGTVRDDDFRPAAPLEIAARVLRNLKCAHAMANRWPAALCVQQRLAALLPQVPQERRDLGLIYLRLGQPAKALPCFEQYLSECGSEQAAALQSSVQAARRMIAELN